MPRLISVLATTSWIASISMYVARLNVAKRRTPTTILGSHQSKLFELLRSWGMVVGIFGLLLSCAFGQSSKGKVDEIATALQSKNFDRALELLHTALREAPSNGELWAMQGAAYAGQRDTKEALASFRRALELSPDNIPALHGAIQIEYDNGDAAAIPLLQHLLKLRPE